MLQLELNKNQKTVIVGEDLEQAMVDEFSGFMERELKKNDGLDMVIDLDGCNFVDSGNLGVISQANRELTSRGRRLKLINVRRGVWSTLEVTSLDKILDIERKD
jgi:anti-anti-sigma factor